jgi:tRNA-dihydrouridine synthase
MIDLSFTESERPIVAQFFTANPEKMFQTSKLALDLGFDGIDINMGCPEKNIQKQGSGACLIKNPELAKSLVVAAKEGCENKIPVSVKTRIGYNADTLEDWLPNLFEVNPAAITIHARTKKEMSKVPAKWGRIADAVKLRDSYFKNSSTKPLIIGNGDVRSLEEAKKLTEEFGVDGVMIGRGIFGNPWFFNHKQKKEELPVEEILKVMLEHTKLFWEELVPLGKSFEIMKKNFKAYATSFTGSTELRGALYECKTYEEVEKVVNHFLSSSKQI